MREGIAKVQSAVLSAKYEADAERARSAAQAAGVAKKTRQDLIEGRMVALGWTVAASVPSKLGLLRSDQFVSPQV